MLYPPTNSPILIFSTFDTPSSYICCFQPVLFDFYSPPTICNANSSKHSTLKKKGLLLPSKTSPFTLQNESFYNAKGPLSESERSPFEIMPYYKATIYR